MQLTPLRVPEIGAFLNVNIIPKVIPIYRCGATDGQAVRRLGNVAGIPFSMLMKLVALPKRPLCRLRRAGARGATCGTTARGADCPLCRCGTQARSAESLLWVA